VIRTVDDIQHDMDNDDYELREDMGDSSSSDEEEAKAAPRKIDSSAGMSVAEMKQIIEGQKREIEKLTLKCKQSE